MHNTSLIKKQQHDVGLQSFRRNTILGCLTDIFN